MSRLRKEGFIIQREDKKFKLSELGAVFAAKLNTSDEERRDIEPVEFDGV